MLAGRTLQRHGAVEGVVKVVANNVFCGRAIILLLGSSNSSSSSLGGATICNIFFLLCASRLRSVCGL